ncbi:MAG: SDR family oxidoreductase [Luteitalea sp.]|nr:SDR family oxidoreductase [Luteitalea sp.]
MANPAPSSSSTPTPAPSRAADVALVTGASSGFGLLISVELARRGLRVYASMRDLGRADRLRAAADQAGVRLELVELDVTRADSIERAAAEVKGAAGRIDVLVNNAGYGIGGAVEDLSMAELREQFETNFFGLVALTKVVLPGMRERRRGRIVNLSSIGGRIATPGLAAYNASKFAVEGFSEALRHELRPFQVFVSLVEPGMFRTDIFDRNRRLAARAHDPGSPWFEATRRLEKVVDRRVEKSTADPRRVAMVVAAIAKDPRPRLRYLVGRDARAQSLLARLLPARLWESAIGRATGMASQS